MKLSENKFYILKDISMISKVGVSGGCLPLKDALIYDQQELLDLQEHDYVKSVTLMKPCGGEIRGFKLTHKGEWTLRKMEAKFLLDSLDNIAQVPSDQQCLTPDQVDILRDIYHFCRLRKSGGLFPRKEADTYSPDDLEFLYLNGYIMKIQAGIRPGKKEKGFVLSNKGEEIVKNIEEPKEKLH